MASAADTLKKVFLELGGKSAFVILDEADLRLACVVAAFTVCTHAGQGCAITTRLVVPRSQFDDAVERHRHHDGAAPGRRSHQSPHRLRAPDQRPPARPGGGLPAAGRRGGRLVRLGGGRPEGLDTGYYVEPTLIVGVDNTAPGGPGGDLRPGAGGHPPRRRRPRRGPGQRVRPTGCRARCGPPTASGRSAWPTGSAPARWASTVASGISPTCRSAGTSSPGIGRESGRGRVRGVPGDQVHRRAGGLTGLRATAVR